MSGYAWLAAFLALLSGPALALGDEYFTSDKMYDDSGDWSVTINLARRSCFIMKLYDNNTLVEVGGDGRAEKFAYYMMFANGAWGKEKDGKYPVAVTYNGRSRWDGDGIGMVVAAVSGVTVEGVKEDTVVEFAGMNVLNLKIDGVSHGTYNLAGSRKALLRMFDCIKEIETGRISLAAISKEFESADDNQAPPPKEDGGVQRGEAVAEGEQAEKKEPEAGKGVMYSTGTGFFINGDGFILTNAHVVDGCKDAMVRHGNTDIQSATIVAREKTNDLALLKVPEKVTAFGKFRGTPQIRLGDSIVVFGYPLAGLLSSSGNLSTGLVASLAGAADDVTRLQISAPVQSGNSGGAVVDQSGHVVGIVVAKSNYQARGTAEHPDIEVIQNVNFAIKAGMAQFFLDANQVHYDIEPPGDDLKTPDVADIARNFSVQVACEMRK